MLRLRDIAFTKTTRALLESPPKHPLRKNTKALYNMGIEMRRLKKNLKKVENPDGSRLTWIKYINDLFGKKNYPVINKAVKISKFEIPEHVFRLQPFTNIYYQCNQGFWPMHKIEPTPFTITEPATETKVKKKTETYTNDRHNKDIVENFVINMGRQYIQPYDNINCLTLTCDRYQMHIDRLFETFPSTKKVYVIERNPKKLEIIYQAARECPHHHEGLVTILPLDASEIVLTNCQFIDLDIGGSLATNTETIRRYAKEQNSSLKKGTTNIFAFSFASRGGAHANSESNYKQLEWIVQCFDVKLLGFNGSEGDFGKKGPLKKSGGVDMPGSINQNYHKHGAFRYCKKHTVEYYKTYDHGAKVHDIVYFTYNDDNGPMGHMAIAYTS